MYKNIVFAAAILSSSLPYLALPTIEFISSDKKYSMTLGGSITGYYGILNQKSLFGYKDAGDKLTRELNNRNALAISADLSINLEAKIDELSKYGIYMKLNANPSPASSGRNYIADKNMFYFENSKYGRIEIGTYNGAHDRIQVSPSNFAAGTGGPDGDYGFWIRHGAFFYSGPNGYHDLTSAFYTDINLPGASNQKRANKITFYSAPIYGFSAGLSFVPDTDVYGTIFRSVDGKKDEPEVYKQGFGYRNVLEGGVKYEGQFKELSYAISLMGELGQAKDVVTTLNNGDITKRAIRHDLAAYEIGASTTFNDFTFAAAYADLGKSGSIKKITESNGDIDAAFNHMLKVKPKASYYSLGASYVYDKAKISVTYYNSDALLRPVVNKEGDNFLNVDVDGKANKFDMISLGLDYNIFDNLKLFAEYNYFKYSKKEGENIKYYNDQIPVNDTNKGSVILLGLKAKF